MKKILIAGESTNNATGFARVTRELSKGLSEEYLVSSCDIRHTNLDTMLVQSKADIVLLASHIKYVASAIRRSNSVGMQKWVGYVFFEAGPLDQRDISDLGHLEAVAVPSRWCQSVLPSYRRETVNTGGYTTLTPVQYVPLGVDKTKFYESDHILTRKTAPTSRFVVGTVASNSFRKQIPRLIQAFSMLHKTHRRTTLWLHCTPHSDSGWNIPALLTRYGVEEAAHTLDMGKMQTTETIPDPVMKATYDQMHLMVMPTMGESFCLPALEAMACGVPVIATDCSAIPELVPKENLIRTSDSVILPWDDSVYSLCNIEHMYDLMVHYYTNKGARDTAVEKALQVAKNYSWGECVHGWMEILKGIDTPEQKGDVYSVDI